MAPINPGVCIRWPYDFSICHNIPSDIPAERVEEFVQAASEYLWALTGRRFGPSCEINVRPCRKSCADGYDFLYQGQSYGYRSTGGWIPYMRDGQMYNASLCGCTSNCQCGPELCEVELVGPVYDVLDVTIGTETLNEFSYRVMDGRFLVRNHDAGNTTLGDGCWPACQDMGAVSGADNTFAVRYRTGLKVPKLGELAVSALAAHMLKDCKGDCGTGCSTGTRDNLRRLSRQGVDLEFVDPAQLFGDSGRTGIAIVDQFIAAFGDGPRAPLRVLSPDYRRPRYEQGDV